MYPDVSCVYLEGFYMYPACILVSQMNLNAMLSYLQLAIHVGVCCPQGVTYYTHYFEIRIPDNVKHTVKIHVSWALPWCRSGYILISKYIG